jgi:hypothetical protein
MTHGFGGFEQLLSFASRGWLISALAPAGTERLCYDVAPQVWAPGVATRPCAQCRRSSLPLMAAGLARNRRMLLILNTCAPCGLLPTKLTSDPTPGALWI